MQQISPMLNATDNKMVVRLRAARAAADANARKDHARGHQNGEDFAANNADEDQLRRLAADAGMSLNFPGSGRELAERLFKVIHGVRRLPPYDADYGDPVENYWEEVPRPRRDQQHREAGLRPEIC